MEIVLLDNRFRVLIPQELREGLAPGDHLAVRRNGDALQFVRIDEASTFRNIPEEERDWEALKPGLIEAERFCRAMGAYPEGTDTTYNKVADAIKQQREALDVDWEALMPQKPRPRRSTR